jgi:hypothetical protein
MRWVEFGLNRSVVAGILWRRRREFARYGLLGAVSRCESHTTRGWSQASAFAWHRYLQRRRRSRAEMTQRAAPSKWTGRAHMFGIAAVDRDIMRVTHGHRRTISVVAERLTLCRRSVSAESAKLRQTYVWRKRRCPWSAQTNSTRVRRSRIAHDRFRTSAGFRQFDRCRAVHPCHGHRKLLGLGFAAQHRAINFAQSKE